MAKTAENTRERIIEAGARIIHKNGFNNTGIKEILDEVGVPKGSFYFYFKNKEDFGLQVLEHFTARFGAMAREVIEQPGVSPLLRLKRLQRSFRDFFEAQHCTLGCPVGNLAQEMGDLSPAFAERLSTAVDAMAAMYRGLLVEAQRVGEISRDIDARETAYFIVAGWHGALLQMKVKKDIGPLDHCLRLTFERVLGVPVPDED